MIDVIRIAAPHFSVKRHNNQVETESAWNVKSFDIEFVGAANNIYTLRCNSERLLLKHLCWLYSAHAMYHSWKHIRSIYQILELRSWSEMYIWSDNSLFFKAFNVSNNKQLRLRWWNFVILYFGFKARSWRNIELRICWQWSK